MPAFSRAGEGRRRILGGAFTAGDREWLADIGV
jgi:hypothetical protein